MDYKKIIGEEIGQYRREKGFSQETLAASSDMHPDYIGKIERGERSPSLMSLLRILDELKVNYGEFFDKIDEIKKRH